MNPTILQLATQATNLNTFNSIDKYANFCQQYLTYIHDNLQAVIVARNEPNYHFFQYNAEANYAITRPINTNLMYSIKEYDAMYKQFKESLTQIKETRDDIQACENLNRFTYTLQQSIGAALDALPTRSSNRARKINGQLFEKLIRAILNEIGINVSEGNIKIPVIVEDQKAFEMNYQHDIIVGPKTKPQAIGSIKTSSKDRLDKIFIDKFLYNQLTEQNIPHFAVFLNDVQRTGREPKYQINTTFLTGRFKGYTVKLNPLDGVYYCDLRPVMKEDPLLNQNIHELSKLLTHDIWQFLE